MLSEIGQNIVHSEDQGFAIIQRYKKPYSHDIERVSEISIGIADLGIGIEESLCRRTPTLTGSLHTGQISSYMLSSRALLVVLPFAAWGYSVCAAWLEGGKVQ